MTSVAERLSLALRDRYIIERELGAGGMATVYLARDLTIGAGGAVSQRWVLPDHRIAAFSGIGAIDRGFVAVLARGRDPAAPATPAVMTRPGCLTAR